MQGVIKRLYSDQVTYIEAILGSFKYGFTSDFSQTAMMLQLMLNIWEATYI